MDSRSRATDGSAFDSAHSEVFRTEPGPARDIEPFQYVDNSTFAAAGNCIVCSWTGRVTRDAMQRSGERVQSMSRAYPGGITLMIVLQPNLPLANTEERAMLNDWYTRHGSSFRGVASVVLGDGFWASAVRGVLTALHSMGTRPYPSRVFATTRAAADWFEILPGFRTSEPNGLRALLERLDRMPRVRPSLPSGRRRSMPP